MAESVKILRRRLRTIRNTKQITRAMEMVSAAKLRRAQSLLIAGRPYAGKLRELLGRLAGAGSIEHPFFSRRDVRKRWLVVVTADRGLAGSFNAQIAKRAEAYLRNSNEPTEVVCVGRKGFDYFKTKSWPIAWSITDLAGVLSSGRANELADRLAQAFLSGEVDEIVLLYNSFVSTLVYRPTQEQLLPLSADALSAVPTDTVSVCPQADYLLEPDAAQLLESLLPRSIRSKVYIVLAETFTAEHSARMVAMSGATRNCEELTEALTLRMNKARQASITKEIIEIVSGAEALSG